MKFIVTAFFFLSFFKMNSQETLNTSFYKLELPTATSYEYVNSTSENSANINIYKVLDDDSKKVKYLVYLMSNKLNEPFSENINVESYLSDIGDYELLKSEKYFKGDKKHFELTLKMEENIIAAMYLTASNDVLYRVLVMIPEMQFESRDNEIDYIFENIGLLKKKWPTS